MRSEHDLLGALLGLGIKYAAKGVYFAYGTAVSLVNAEVDKQEAREKLDILEYQEDAKRKRGYYTPNELEEHRLITEIQTTDPNFDGLLFEKYAEHVFREIFKAYCDDNLDSIRRFVNVNIIELYKIHAHKNTLENNKEVFDIVDVNFVDFFGHHYEGNLEIISVAIGLVYYNYIQNPDGEVIQGFNDRRIRKSYVLSFGREKGGQTINNLKNYEDGKLICPNCGATIESLSNECEHCKTILFNSTSNWLLTYIEQL